MARSKSSSGMDSKTLIIVALVCVIVAFFVFKDKDGSSSPSTKKSTTTEANTLPISDYMMRGSALRDNEYKLTGKVENRDIMGDGEIITLIVEEVPGKIDRIPVVMPKEAKSINIEREQSYKFDVRIENRGENKGLIIATKVTNA